MGCVAYYAHAMTGRSWRERSARAAEVREIMERYGIRVLDPGRGLEPFDRYDVEAENLGFVRGGTGDPVAHAFVDDDVLVAARALHDIRVCDVLIVDGAGMKEPSLGVCVEIGFARALNRPVLGLLHHDHPLLRSPMTRTLFAFLHPDPEVVAGVAATFGGRHDA